MLKHVKACSTSLTLLSLCKNYISFCNLQNFATLKTQLLWSFSVASLEVFDMPEVDVPNDEAPESPKATFPSHLDKLGALAKKKVDVPSDQLEKNDLLWKKVWMMFSCDSCDSYDILWLWCVCVHLDSGFDIDGMLSCFIDIAVDVPGTTFQTPSDWGQTLRKWTLITLLFLDMSNHRCDFDTSWTFHQALLLRLRAINS